MRDRALSSPSLRLRRTDMFPTPQNFATEVFTRLPDALRRADQPTAWSEARGGPPLHSFLEGPAFDRAGNLYCVDVCHGRIFRIDVHGRWHVFADYDGNPNGLKIHQDGRVFVADHKLGLLCFDAHDSARTVIAEGCDGTRFGGLNDLVFADNGDLYFTDPGESALENLSGRVFRLRHGAKAVELLMDGLAYPNGLVLSPTQDVLYVAVTRSQQILRLPLQRGGVYEAGVFIQLTGGLAGPDGMALAHDGSLVIVHAGFGTVWVFSPMGEPMGRVRSCAGMRTTNVAFGLDDERTIFVTEAEHGVILRAHLHVTGRRMYSHTGATTPEEGAVNPR